MSDTLTRATALQNRLMAIYNLIPANAAIPVADICRGLAEQGIDLQGIALNDALRYIEGHGLIKPNAERTRWRRCK